VASHATCYEKDVQETDEWCVAASVQMLLEFYRYTYPQERIATDLGLGTRTAPTALPAGKWGDVVTRIEALSSNALQATRTDLDFTLPMVAWQLYRAEIQANRPAISFVSGHSRTIAGYLEETVAGLTYNWLTVYDPYGPTGAGPSPENITYAMYVCAFTAQLILA
jgi:hypothetical protein